MNTNTRGVFWKGMAMGVAEIIPGVSGGTIAFITGIYEKLMQTITSVDANLLKLLLKGHWKEAFSKLDIGFVLRLATGMITGIVFGVFAISYFLEHYPEPLWGFFFGLIIASVLYIANQWETKDYKQIIALVLGALAAYGITIISPADGNTSYPFIFISAVIAISAMLLPGISGSFMLVILGMYNFILGSLKSVMTDFDVTGILVVLVFLAGVATGAATFARIFSWLFARFKNITLAVLTGFLIGSLNKIWPWRNVQQIFDKTSGKLIEVNSPDVMANLDPESIKIISEVPVLPSLYQGDPKVVITILSCLAGFLILFFIDFYKKGKA